MDVLPLNFRTLNYCGAWTEEEKNSSILKSTYGIAVWVIVFYFTFSLIAGAFMLSNIDDLTETLFITLTFTLFCIKLINFAVRKQSMKILLERFRSDVCQPRSTEEKKILDKYQNASSKIYIYFVRVGAPSCAVLAFAPLLKLINNEMQLPFRTYQPYDMTKVINFALIYAMQSAGLFLGFFMNVSLDTMTSGFLILTSGQYELCSYRMIKNSGEEKEASGKEWINHHVLILDIVRRTEAFFISAIVPFILCCMITLCSSIFQMAKLKPTSVEFFSVIMYLMSLLFEILLYCWNGNELQLQSQRIVDAAYSSDWIQLRPHHRKNVCLAMLVGQKGSKISYHGQCTLSLDTFVWIVKTSYGAFSLLQRVSMKN